MQRGIHVEVVRVGNTVVDLGHILVAIWFGVAIYKLAKLIECYHKLNRLVDMLPKEKVENELALMAGVTVYKSKYVNNPCSVGIINQIVLFPYRNYSKQQEEYILKHEISHHKNRDILIKLFINIMCALYWWNPLVFLLKKDINQSLEIRCDQNVTQYLEKEERAEYLAVILEEFRNSLGALSESNEYIMEILGDDDTLVERFKIVAKGRYSNSVWKKIVITVAIVTIFLGSYSFIIQSAFDMPQNEIEDGGYYYSESDSYIMDNGDGTYSLVTPISTIKLKESQAEFYLNEGFQLKRFKDTSR